MTLGITFTTHWSGKVTFLALLLCTQVVKRAHNACEYKIFLLVSRFYSVFWSSKWIRIPKNYAWKRLIIWCLIIIKRFESHCYSYYCISYQNVTTSIVCGISCHDRSLLPIFRILGMFPARMEKSFSRNGLKIIPATDRLSRNTWFEAMTPMETRLSPWVGILFMCDDSEQKTQLY